MDFKLHQYTHALVGKVTPGCSYGDGIDGVEVRRQHDSYTRLLRELNIEVIEVDLQGSLHEQILIENMAVIWNGTALLPRRSSAVEKNNVSIKMYIFLISVNILLIPANSDIIVS